MDQKRKRMVKPLDNALIRFTERAALSGPLPNKGANTTINRRPSITNNGAPGGWGTCILKVLDMNSPQSHKLPVASMVMMYTVQAIIQMAQPVILFNRLKVI